MTSPAQPLSRRSFLRRAGAVAVTTALGPVVLDCFTPLGQAAAAAAALPTAGSLPPGTPIVVVIDLQGGNDFLNTVCPIGDPWYYDRSYGRGDLAISPSSALPLTGTGFGLHPSLAWLHDRWQTVGDVALVLGVGENVWHEFSHFKAMDLRNTAALAGASATGWLGRYNDIVAPDSPVAAISTCNLHPSLLASTVPILQVTSCASMSISSDWRWSQGYLDALKEMGRNTTATGMVGRSTANHRNVIAAVDRVSAAANDQWQSTSGWLEEQLLQCAMLIASGLPAQTYVTTTSGYDTHGSQSWMHGDLLGNLDNALRGFFKVMDAQARRGDVFVVIASEFGRQVRPNGSSGTDHGQAGGCMVVGGGVRGGLYGQQPTLAPGGPTAPNRIDDALVPTVDFRSVYATVLDRLSGFDGTTASRVLGGSFATLPWWGPARPAASAA